MLRAFKTIATAIFLHREFALEMGVHELKGANKGAILGIGWLIIQPLVQVSAYVVIISIVFKVEAAQNMGVFGYALHILSGLIAWQFVQRMIERAPNLVRERTGVLKQTIYPIETLPVSAMLVLSIGPGIGFIVYLVLAMIDGTLHFSMILLPIPVLLTVCLVIGSSWFLMVAGVLIKDLREVISAVLGLMVYISPVIVTREMVGEEIWKLILLNPLSHVVISFRDVLQETFHPISWLIFIIFSAFMFFLGAVTIFKAKAHINEHI